MSIQSSMAFQSFTDLMQMSGHGLYVWTAYGISFVVVMYLIFSPVFKTRKFLKQQALVKKREETTGSTQRGPQHTIT